MNEQHVTNAALIAFLSILTAAVTVAAVLIATNPAAL